MPGRRLFFCILCAGRLRLLATLLVIGMCIQVALCSTAAAAHSTDGRFMKMSGSGAWGKVQRWSSDPERYGPPFQPDPKGFNNVNRNLTSFSLTSPMQTVVTLFVPNGSYLVTATGSAERDLFGLGTTSIPNVRLQCSIAVPGGLTGGALDTVLLGRDAIATLAVTDSVTVYGDGQIQLVCTWLNPGLLGAPVVDAGASISAVKVKLNELGDDIL